MKTLSLQSISESSEEFLRQTYPQVLRRFCDHAFFAGILFICFATVTYGLTTITFGGFNSGAAVNLTDDWGLPVFLAYSFGMVYYYFRMPELFSRMLTTLRDNSVFTSSEVETGEFASKFSQNARMRRVPIYTGLILFALQNVTAPPRKRAPVFWYDAHPVNAFIVTVTWLPLWIIISGLVLSIVTSGATLNAIFTRNKILVHSLHPDKSGGFGAVGNFAFRMTIMALLPGIMLIVVIWRSIELNVTGPIYPAFLLLSLGYVVVVPLLFYLLIRGGHKAMEDFRNSLIERVCLRYSNYNFSIRGMQNREEDWVHAASTLEQMDTMKRLATHASSYPVWPFGMRMRVGVVVNSILPLSLTLIGILVDIK